jgi:hypothetical protein
VQGKLVTCHATGAPAPSAKLAPLTDASTTAMGAALQQRVNNAWQPLAFFSKKLNPTQQKYSAYDRELLAACEGVKYFRHMLKARNLIIFTDHKTNHLRFPAETKQLLTAAIQPPGLHSTVHDRHTKHIRTGQRCRRRALPRRIRCCATIARHTSRSKTATTNFRHCSR